MSSFRKRPVVREPREFPLPLFERNEFIDRGYYLVSEFQDEKRRRDRARAVYLSRRHPNYTCLMTPDHRLLHRNTYTRAELPLFFQLQSLISTWTTPKFYILGYEIKLPDLLQGLGCYQRMGSTCNPTISTSLQVPSYLGCPRASISMKFQHPRSWYSLYVPRLDNPKRFMRVSAKDEGDALGVDPGAANRAYKKGIGEMRHLQQENCGCPLIHYKRTEEVYLDRLPVDITVGEGIWHMAPDMMGEMSLQPKNKRLYDEFLGGLGLSQMPTSDRPDAAVFTPPVEVVVPEVVEVVEKEEVEDDIRRSAARRRKLRARFDWL